MTEHPEPDKQRIWHCKTCAHWNGSDKYGTGASLGLGLCEATPMFFESTQWSDDRNSSTWTSSAEHRTAFVQDDSNYRASLYTKANHGCTMHEPK